MSPLHEAILRALAEEGRGAAMSLPRLAKRLELSASVLLRSLSLLGDARIAGRPGPGWVRVWQEEGRWLVALTEAGWAWQRAT